MPEYRDVKRPTALAAVDLTEEQAALVEAGGNEAAIGTDLKDEGEGSQLDIWYLDDRTLVRAVRNGSTVRSWSFAGYISPHDCREWYLASLKG